MKLFALLFILTLGGLLTIIGCSGKDDPPPDVSEAFRGELHIDFSPQIVGEQWVDTVLFTVHNGVYSITYLSHNGSPSSLCDVEGGIGGFNTAQVRLTPQTYSGSNCSQRGPTGEFVAQFVGDSLKLDNIDQTAAIFEFRLKNTAAKNASFSPTKW